MLGWDGRGILRMADNGAGTGGGPALPPANKPGGDAGDGPGVALQPGNTGTGDASSGEVTSLESALAELAKVRRALKDVNAESAGRRKRLEELEAAESQRQQAQMSEAEKAKAAAQRLNEELAARDARLASLQEQTIRYEVMLAAQAMQIVDLDAAVRLMDRDALEIGEDGRPTNVEAVLKALIKAKPYLVKQAAATATAAPNINAQAQGSRQDADAARLEDIKKRFRLG
jgi:hypothetical protein